MGYAFISYSSKNLSSANAILELFKKYNIDTWMAPNDIPVGSKYALVINRALKNCSCLVLLLTSDAQNSRWVAKEVERAINYGKVIIPIKLDDIELNDEFDFYLSTDQIIAVQKIDDNTEETKQILDSVKAHTQMQCESKSLAAPQPTHTSSDTENLKKASETTYASKKIELIVWSPVNTDVYLNDKKHLVMKIDHNSGFDYKHNSINVSGEFQLIFISKGFEKTVNFDADSIDKRLEYRLYAILSKKEITASYDRDEALEQISEYATAYAYKQLSKVGTSEDIELLVKELVRLSSIQPKDHHTNYLIAVCTSAVGELAIKNNRLEDIVIILDIYENYEAKSSYGYIMEPTVKNLNDAGFTSKSEGTAEEPFINSDLTVTETLRNTACVRDKVEDASEKEQNVNDNDSQKTSPTESVKNHQSNDGTYVIPDGTKIIEAHSFAYRKDIKSIIIPNTVTKICKNAFYECDSLISITLPDSITSIEESAFSKCSSLKKIKLPKHITRIEAKTFEDCKKLNKIIIPDGVTIICELAFCNCESLSSINIPKSVINIESCAFAGCKGLQDKNGFVIVNNTLFDYYGNNETIYIPQTVTAIDNIVFFENETLETIILPKGLKKIGASAFYGCKKLKNISIPASIENIDNSAFKGCEFLQDKYGFVIFNNILFDYLGNEESAIIPYGVTHISSEAFSGCTNLISITIPDSVTSIESYAFAICDHLKTITIPEGVTIIKSEAFRLCMELHTVIIPKTVTMIDDTAFTDCPNVTICGKADTYAEQYANNHNIPFKTI